MALKEGDLQNTILKNISIDEFEPKTGEAADVMVVGFYLNETAPAKDLYHFINNSILEYNVSYEIKNHSLVKL